MVDKTFLKRFLYVYSIWIGFALVLFSQLITGENLRTIITLIGFGISTIFSLILMGKPKI